MMALLFLLATLHASPVAPPSTKNITSITFSDLRTRLVDRAGQGPDAKPSVFVNMRAVLPGLVFRSGVNPAYSPPVKSPLSSSAMNVACATGFDKAYFLYDKRIPEPLAQCVRDGRPAQLSYFKATVTVGSTGRDVVLGAIHAAIMSGERHPILLQDIGGRHAAGYISAIVLRQFCGMSADQAVAYYDATDDDDSRKNGQELVRKIKCFTPLAHFSIPAATKMKVCPQPL